CVRAISRLIARIAFSRSLSEKISGRLSCSCSRCARRRSKCENASAAPEKSAWTGGSPPRELNSLNRAIPFLPLKNGWTPQELQTHYGFFARDSRKSSCVMHTGQGNVRPAGRPNVTLTFELRQSWRFAVIGCYLLKLGS